MDAAPARKTLWHAALLLLLGAFWGLQFVLLKIATDAGTGQFEIVLTSMFLLAAGFLTATAVTRAWFRLTWRYVRFFLTSGFLGFVAPLGLVVLAAGEISAGLIVLFEALTPVFTIALALVLRIEAASRRRLASMILAALGISCVLVPALTTSGGVSPLGIAFALGLPVVYGLDCLYVAARWPDGLSPLQIVTGETVGGVLQLLLISLFWPGVGPSSFSWSAGLWPVLMFAAVGFVEAYLYFYLIRQAGAVFVSLGSLISLFAGIGFGILLLGESHPASVWLAVGLAALALYVPFHRKRTRTVPELGVRETAIS
ncbi:MAG: DMT family transporter [Alphaproteobacteria bacterium]